MKPKRRIWNNVYTQTTPLNKRVGRINQANIGRKSSRSGVCSTYIHRFHRWNVISLLIADVATVELSGILSNRGRSQKSLQPMARSPPPINICQSEAVSSTSLTNGDLTEFPLAANRLEEAERTVGSFLISNSMETKFLPFQRWIIPLKPKDRAACQPDFEAFLCCGEVYS